MKEVEFTGESMVLREEIEMFGETEVKERRIEYADRGEFELKFDTGGYVSLESLVDVKYSENNTIESLTLCFDRAPSLQAAARSRGTQGPGESNELPPVPNIDSSEIDVQARWSFYERLRKSSDSQPAQIRRLIFEHQRLTREEFDQLVEDELGYAADGGGVNMCLVVLEEVTGEINRDGRGDSQIITWNE